MRFALSALAALALLPACTVDNSDGETGTATDTDTTAGTTGTCTPGMEGCACDAAGACEAGLDCVEDMCVEHVGVCGDDTLDANEECDDGPNNADTAACKSDCTLQACGDGFVGPGEACDDGNTEDLDECSNACVEASCGDGVVQMSEQCDDGNTEDTDACPTTCLDAVCGDGLVYEGMEDCDDANVDETDGCAADCSYAPLCGDGIPVATELCYESGVALLTKNAPWQAKIADVTNDDVPDVVVSNLSDDDIRVFRNDGTGMLTSDGDFGIGGVDATDIEIGDVDGDGIKDIVVLAFASDKTVVLFGTQAAPADPVVFGVTHDVPAIAGGPLGLDMADLNGDGRDDIVVSENEALVGCYPVGVYGGNADRTMTLLSTAQSVCDAGADGEDVVIGNFKNDPNLMQIIATRPDQPQFDIMQGYDQMSMSTTVQPLPAMEFPREMAVGRINNDDNDDLLVPMWSSTVCNYQADINACDGDELWLYIGDSNDVLFNSPFKIDTGAKGVSAAATADVTSDGVDDVLVVSQHDNKVTVLVNDSIGNLSVGDAYDTQGTFPIYVDAGGDLNGDTVPEIVAVNAATNSIVVFYSNP